MRSLGIAFLPLALLAVACGGDDDDNGGTAGAAGSTAGTGNSGTGGSTAGKGGAAGKSGGAGTGTAGTNTAGTGTAGTGDEGGAAGTTAGNGGTGGAQACGSLTFTDPACTACATGTDGCCAENEACSKNKDCTAYLTCIQACQDAACQTKCGTDHPTGKPLLDALDTCLTDKCADTCTTPPLDNHTFETASPLTIGQSGAQQSEITDFAKQKDFYKLTGTKGQKLYIFASGKPNDAPLDPTYPDLVVTLYNSAKTQIAANDDPPSRSTNNSQLITILPADGDYYVRVVECNGYEKGGPDNCSDASKITHGDYSVGALVLDTTQAGNVGDTEPNDTADKATTVTYAPVTGGTGYYQTLILGGFSTAADVDTYAFKLPANTPVSSGRSVARFELYPVGVDGNGSTSLVGEVTLAAKADPTKVIARVDISKVGAQGDLGDLTVPLALDTDYVLTVKHPGTAAGANDFYVFSHSGGGSNPVETEKTNENSTAATAEALKAQANDDGSTSYFIEGDLLAAPADVDFFSIAVPAKSADQISVSCAAQRSGSGLRGFKASITDASGTVVSNATATESETADVLLQNVPTPAGQTKLLVKLEAASQDAATSSTFYRCGIHFSAK